MEKEKQRSIAFTMRVIHNQIKAVIHKSFPRDGNAPQSQLQGGILGYLYHHSDEPVYQKDIEKEFRISGATATNTLQVMEKNGLIVRKSQDRDARLKRVVLTESACERHARVEEHMQLMDRRILQGMTEAEISELYRLLGKLQGNLEQMEAECGIENRELQ
ncbi:MAG: MarR family transcriptional regulator [Eubacterium sp.]|nr:MarR family transcriptional regulator [Eubacterium sp.]MCM1213375.1 MarR family transcriptional regulator [Lachnospiraceae bacterium]MCM1305112.1 MarR family transcriptional regulator [Butyrivibrio sp.]MCM1344120.1 MarR family transcriptional regulator [Muribaculaceae bacterium]MCM1241094.1 MarR family transcriptional regulator [Lachnospiraceae bacterium]